MRKFLIAVFLSFAIALTASLPASAVELTDINGNWAQKEIQYFVDQGIIVGYGDGTFFPEKSVTRAEFVRIVNNAYNFNTPASISFKDVKSSDWYYNDVRYAVAAGFISGYSDNTFRPNNNITREEVASIIQRILKVPANTSYAPKTFIDVPATSHYNGAIGALTSSGVMIGTSGDLFSPQSNETRADTAYSLYNALFNSSGQTEEAKNTVIDGNVIVREKSYGPSSDFSKESIPGNLTIKSSNSETKVKNVTIQGDVIIEQTAKRVYLENVTIRGRLIVNGGERLYLEKTDVQEMDVNNLREAIAINSSSDSICYNSNIYTTCTLTEDSETLSNGFSNVVINGNKDVATSVDLSGRFVAVDVYANKTTVNLQRGQITDLYFNIAAGKSTANLKSGTTVSSVEINAEDVKITGTGTVYAAKIEASNATLNNVPQKLTGAYAPKYTSDVEKNNLVITVVNRNNAPVSSAKVTLSSYSSSKTTDSDGKVTYTNVPMGTYDYTVEKSGFTTASGTVAVSDYSTTRKVTISSTASYSLSITVLDNSTSASVSSASVDLKNVSSSSTSSNGLVTFSGLENGDYTYTISKSGYTAATGTVTISGSNANRTVRLVPTNATYDVEFYVRNSSSPSTKLSGAKVTVTGSAAKTTDANGYVKITGISKGTHDYTVTHNDYKSFSGSVSGASTQNVVLDSNTFSVTINVKDGTTNIDDASVTLNGTSKQTKNGSVTFTGIAPGSYKVTVSKKDYEASEKDITVGNSDLSVEMQLQLTQETETQP